MRSEHGQATVEWVGLVLLLALAFAALARVAPRPDGRGLGAALVHVVTCAARGDCQAEPAQGVVPGARPRLVVVPPLVPITPSERPRPRRGRGRPPRAVARRLRRALRSVWRGAWFVCFAYERFRHDLAHPETRLPGVALPTGDGLRIVNDCLNPVDPHGFGAGRFTLAGS